MEKLRNYINGKFCAPASRKYIENVEPATGKVYTLIPDSDSRDVEKAVAAAEAAKRDWAAQTPESRAAVLNKLADLIEENLDEFALAESRDNGKPLWLAKAVDIPRAARNFRFYATAAAQFASESSVQGDVLNYTLRKPIGIAGCISPWNLPLYLFSWKIAPALAAGCCVVAKPSEVTPMTAYLMCRLLKKAGFPDGVINIVHGTGPGAGAPIIEHPAIPAISFTGGTATGEWIARTAAPMFKKLSLELGGKNPTVVFDDCDFENTVRGVVRAAFANQGQICLCGSRIYVQQGIYEKFRDAFVEKVSRLTCGDPLKPKTKQGAVVSESHMEKVLSYIDVAQEEGGVVLTGGKRALVKGRCKDGYFIEPTVVEGLTEACRTNQEEIFGPVCTIQPFTDEAEAVYLANSTKYGLASSVWTQDLNRAHRMAAEIEAGIVWINCWLERDLRTPFGGVKHSGVGREGGMIALDFFTEPTNVAIKVY